MKPGEIARNVSRGAFFLALEKGAASLSTILYSALVVRWLGPGQYGVFTLAFSMVTLAGAFTGNFEMYLERFAAEHQVRDRLATLARAFWTSLLLKCSLGIVAAAALVGLSPWLAARYHMAELVPLLALLTAFLLSDACAATGRSLLFGLQRYEWVSGLSLIVNLGRAVLAAALWATHHGIRALATGLSILSIAQALALCGAAVVVLRRTRASRDPASGPECAPEPGLLKSMMAYCAPLYGANLSFLSGQNFGKLVLGLVLTPWQLGLFAFAFTTVERLVEVVYTLPRSLLPSLTAMSTSEDRERLHHVFSQAFRLVQVVACALSFLIFVYAREVVMLVGGPMFQRTVPLLRILALVPVVRTAQQPLTMLFQATRRPGFVLALALLKLGVEVGGYALLVLWLRTGGTGACWSNLAGAVAAFIGAMALAGRVLPEGSGERLRAVLASLLLLLPLLGLALASDRFLGDPGSLGVRLLLAPAALIGAIALGLAVPYDLEKLASLPLRHAWTGSVRDRVVAGAGRALRLFGPGEGVVSAPRVLVIVPAHDEVESLPATLAELRRAAPDVDVLVVDDGSRDGTADVARAAGVPVLRHVVNLGVGGALQTGFRFADAHGYDIGVQFDADGQHDPAFLAAVIAPVAEGRCDVAIGSRYVTRTGYHAPVTRRLGMLLFSGVVRLALGRRIADTTSGFRAYGRAVMRACQHDFPSDFPDAPLLITLARQRFRLLEVPVVMRERRAGRSFYTFGRQLYYPYKNLLASLMALLRRPS